MRRGRGCAPVTRGVSGGRFGRTYGLKNTYASPPARPALPHTFVETMASGARGAEEEVFETPDFAEDDLEQTAAGKDSGVSKTANRVRGTTRCLRTEQNGERRVAIIARAPTVGTAACSSTSGKHVVVAVGSLIVGAADPQMHMANKLLDSAARTNSNAQPLVYTSTFCVGAPPVSPECTRHAIEPLGCVGLLVGLRWSHPISVFDAEPALLGAVAR